MNRMAALKKILEAKSIPVKNFYLENPSVSAMESIVKSSGSSGTHRKPLWILDARDADPGPFLESGSVIAVDNRCSDRRNYENGGKVTFFDSLPHPDADMKTVLENMLIDPDLVLLKNKFLQNEKKSGPDEEKKSAFYNKKKSASSNTIKSQAAESRNILIYSGDIQDTEWLDRAVVSLKKKFSVSSIIRIGIAPVSEKLKTEMLQFDRLEKEKMYDLLSRADFIFSYFGMFYFESLYLEKFSYLYRRGEEGSEHDILSRYFYEKTDLPYIKGAEDFKKIDFNLNPAEKRADIRPSGDGYKALVSLILENIEKDT